jgi:hypothetical protein
MQMHENRPKTMAEKAMGEIDVVDVKAKEVKNDDQTRDK